MEQVVLQVSGMTCNACEQRIQKALSRLEGVRTSSADHQRGEVRVVFDPNRTPEQAVRTCISQTGYEVAG